MLKLQNEQIVSFREATAILPKRRGGKKPHIATLYRWATAGCKGVVLESIQIGGTRCTSVQALQRFFNRLTEASSADDEFYRPEAKSFARSTRTVIDLELDKEGL